MDSISLSEIEESKVTLWTVAETLDEILPNMHPKTLDVLKRKLVRVEATLERIRESIESARSAGVKI